MEITMQVEPAGLGWLRFANRQVILTIRASYVTDVMADVVGIIANVAGGAESGETHLGLEPGDVALRLDRGRDQGYVLTVDVVSGLSGPRGTFAFPVQNGVLAQLGLNLAASVDRETYLDHWMPEATWPTAAIDRLQRLSQAD